MTRPRALLAAAFAVLALAGAVLAPASQSDSAYAVDVVFDDSRGLLVGQLVQIAGARVGQITDVSLTEDYKARVHMEVDRRFAPFREDARCTIKPSGLIAENYVQCDPGTPDAPALQAQDGQSPTVPVENTTQPVSLTDLFETWNTPTRQRVGVLLSTLGVATAGRGEDINAILRRANPSLALAREVISKLERQRDELVDVVEASDELLAELAREPEDVEGLVRHSARVLERTASQRGALAEGLQRLPGLLEQAQPALAKLDALSASATPLVDRLSESAPALNSLSADIPRLAAAARPTLKALGPVLRDGARTAREAGEVTGLVRFYARESLPSTAVAAEMLPALEERGFVRKLAEFFYYAAMATARYDEQGHIIPAHVTFTSCGQYATTPDPGCGGPEPAQEKRRVPRERREAERPAPQPQPEPQPREQVPRPRLPELPKLPELPGLEDLPKLLDPQQLGAPAPQTDAVDDLLDFLFG